MFDLYLITPDLAPRAILERCAAALASASHGRIAVQLRSKQLLDRERRALALELRAMTRASGAALLVNGDVELALDVAADGVQLPERVEDARRVRERLGDALWIGASRHDLPGVIAAAGDGATFVTLSPIFEVADKGPALGLARFAAIAAQSRVPVYGLGGLDAARAQAVVGAGAHGVAVMREVWNSADPARAVAGLLSAIDAGRDQRARSTGAKLPAAT